MHSSLMMQGYKTNLLLEIATFSFGQISLSDHHCSEKFN